MAVEPRFDDGRLPHQQAGQDRHQQRPVAGEVPQPDRHEAGQLQAGHVPDRVPHLGVVGDLGEHEAEDHHDHDQRHQRPGTSGSATSARAASPRSIGAVVVRRGPAGRRSPLRRAVIGRRLAPGTAGAGRSRVAAQGWSLLASTASTRPARGVSASASLTWNDERRLGTRARSRSGRSRSLPRRGSSGSCAGRGRAVDPLVLAGVELVARHVRGAVARRSAPAAAGSPRRPGRRPRPSSSQKRAWPRRTWAPSRCQPAGSEATQGTARRARHRLGHEDEQVAVAPAGGHAAHRHVVGGSDQLGGLGQGDRGAHAPAPAASATR